MVLVLRLSHSIFSNYVTLILMYLPIQPLLIPHDHIRNQNKNISESFLFRLWVFSFISKPTHVAWIAI